MAPTNNAPLPNSPGPFPVQIPIEPGANSLWDRLSNWASENKGVVYTVAGITLVAGAGGAIYYFSDARQDANTAAGNKRKKQRDRKRAKERAEKDTSPQTEERPAVDTESKKASVTSGSDDELPDIDESSVGSLSEEVRQIALLSHG
jgi:import receptor subunit TOM70